MMTITKVMLILSAILAGAFSQTTRKPPKEHDISDQELARISNELHAGDNNGALSAIELNFQNKTTAGDRVDHAPLPLFSKVDNEIFRRPTYAALLALFDNYAENAEIAERVTDEELREENVFLDLILNTNVMQKAHQFLVEHGKADRDRNEFKKFLKTIWFGLYSRAAGKQGSSGFEHVFLGERKNGISGLHNWLRYRAEEVKGTMNYLGFIRTVSLGKVMLIKMPMEWKNTYKSTSSFSIGGSPELEVALYTVCFVARPDSICQVQGNRVRYQIQTFTSVQQGKTFIGSIFPTL